MSANDLDYETAFLAFSVFNRDVTLFDSSVSLPGGVETTSLEYRQ